MADIYDDNQRKRNYLDKIRELFKEYANSLSFDLSLDDFEQDLANIPGKYTPPDGNIFLCSYEKQIAGCVALRSINSYIGEMKRLYVRPEFRGKGIGKTLILLIIKEATKNGYTKLFLHTLAEMKTPIALYHKLGFQKIDDDRYNSIPGTILMELNLQNQFDHETQNIASISIQYLRCISSDFEITSSKIKHRGVNVVVRESCTDGHSIDEILS